jgi:hypothetical protein
MARTLQPGLFLVPLLVTALAGCPPTSNKCVNGMTWTGSRCEANDSGAGEGEGEGEGGGDSGTPADSGTPVVTDSGTPVVDSGTAAVSDLGTPSDAATVADVAPPSDGSTDGAATGDDGGPQVTDGGPGDSSVAGDTSPVVVDVGL